MNHLLALPVEVLHSIIALLPRGDLLNLNLVNRKCCWAATPLIWREVELVDCRSRRARPKPHDGDDGTADATGTTGTATADEEDYLKDEHDDTPLIAKLLIILANERIATSIHVLTHRCHLPPPPIFEYLPRFPFASQSLSTDPRTITLIRLAAREMTHVHTLRIILGHPSITDALLRSFFDIHRPHVLPIRRLWLENTRISAGLNPALADHPYNLPLHLSFRHLQSVRLRRLPMPAGAHRAHHRHRYRLNQFVFARAAGTQYPLPDGAGATYTTSLSTMWTESHLGEESVRRLGQNAGESPDLLWTFKDALFQFYAPIFDLDDAIWAAFSEERGWRVPALVQAAKGTKEERVFGAYRGNWLDPEDLEGSEGPEPAWWKFLQRERIPSARAVLHMFHSSRATLTSLTLDWVLTDDDDPSASSLSSSPPLVAANRALFYRDFFLLRFPHLRAFQYRNAVVPGTLLPAGLFLLDRWRLHVGGSLSPTPSPSTPIRTELDGYLGLEFMEAHPKLQCLAWPMERFFALTRDPETMARVDAVVANLGRTLVELRVDAIELHFGGLRMEGIEETRSAQDDRLSRHRFVSSFAPQMHSLRTLKLEGGIPGPERRAILAALRLSPLEKIVLISTAHPLGNTWGAVIPPIDAGLPVFGVPFTPGGPFAPGVLARTDLEDEDHALLRQYSAIEHLPASPPSSLSTTGPGPPPLLYTIALYHHASLTVLKSCGYRGAPVLLAPTPPPHTADYFNALKFLPRLRRLTTSFWLHTYFEGDMRDAEVLGFWRDRSDPHSTALVVIPPSPAVREEGGDDDDDAEDEDDENPWARALRTKFSPDALARRVFAFLAPLLHPQAKAQPGGVLVRASFALSARGSGGTAIWDLDLRIAAVVSVKKTSGGESCGLKDVILEGSVVGPRTEALDRERRRGKEEGRGWF